jgi:F0F1-type ATP synthase assembly protein I
MKKNYQDYIFGKKHLILTATSLVITLVTIALVAGTGYLIDNYLKTKPAATIIGLLLSYPIAQILIAKRIKQILKK